MKRSVALCFLVSACAAPTPHTVAIPFNPSEVAWFSAPGNNTIHGSAVMRTVGGEVRTCAGLDANLVPNSSYARARFQEMYQSLDRGLLRADSGFKFADTDPNYAHASRTVTCDPQGYFTFTNLPDGDYFVTAKIVWGVPMRYFTSWQGGYLMQRISVQGGETKDIVLSE
jgi:hypothetical protein